MPEEKTEPSPKIETGPITMEELIRAQLQGKLKALERYDSILWKIRSGYVVVLYGAITILGGRESQIAGTLGIKATIDALVYLTVGMSFCAFFVDLGFLLSKLRVVDARNRLSDHAVKLATGEEMTGDEGDELRKLLHLSGEAPTLPPWGLVANGTWTIAFLYATTPTLLFILSRYVKG